MWRAGNKIISVSLLFLFFFFVRKLYYALFLRVTVAWRWSARHYNNIQSNKRQNSVHADVGKTIIQYRSETPAYLVVTRKRHDYRTRVR